MARTSFETLLEAGCHFGHLKRKWNPAMAPYIFKEMNGIHIIDLHKTVGMVNNAAEALKNIAKSGKKVLFVATKKQAKDIVAEKAQSINMPYVIERWPGGMLTNFPTIRKAVKKMSTIDKLIADGTYSNLSKRELLQVTRQRAKLEKNLGSISDLTRLPSAIDDRIPLRYFLYASRMEIFNNSDVLVFPIRHVFQCTDQFQTSCSRVGIET